MNIPTTVKKYLASTGGRFKGRQCDSSNSFESMVASAGIRLDSTVRPVMLKSGKAYLMAIVRGDQAVDISTINRLFQREFELCSEMDISALLPGCDPLALPPLAEPFELQAIMDKSVCDMEQLFFNAGVAGLFIHTDKQSFASLQENTWASHTIAEPEKVIALADNDLKAMRMKVQGVQDLPAMPGIAVELIRARNNPYANARDLAAIIEQDPSLTAQLLRYSTSPLYAYKGDVASIEQAYVRVLGMDSMLDIAFGLSLGKAFNNPPDGPLGLDSFWRHSVYTAALTQALCNAIEFTRRPPAEMGYLAGLLHNFGILLLGHLFPEQLSRLNSAMEANPERNILELERETVGVSHTELGMWLMEAWEMPSEISATVSGHHDPDVEGEFSTYANLVYIANALLKRYGFGDGVSMEIPEKLMQRFGLTHEQLEVVLGAVMGDQDCLDFMASKMAA